MKRYHLLCLLGLLCLPGQLWAQASKRDHIVIGSKNFTENRILAELMAQLIESHMAIKVKRLPNLGGSTVAFTALRSGQIDIYPEYTGTGWGVHLKRKAKVNSGLKAYAIVQAEFRRRFQLQWMTPFGFNNSFAMAMSETSAKKYGIETISDLKKHADKIRAGVTHEFLNREDGYLGLSRVYGLKLKQIRGIQHGLAYQALKKDKLDLVDTWTTDGKLLLYKIRILRDDKHFFPPYDAAPLVRMDTLKKYPRLGPLLDGLGFRLPDRKMQKLNLRVVRGESFAKVAKDFLTREGLMGKHGTKVAMGVDRRVGFVAFMWGRRGQTLRLLWQHLYLTFLAVLLAILFSVPLGVWLTRQPGLAPTVLNGVGVLQTIPGLALLAFMIPIPGLGLGARSAVAALFLYALLPIVRNTYTGIEEIDADLIEAGRGMGLRDFQILWHVQLPLATRTIMAGIRTSTVISIGVATLAAFIGAGGLGDPIITGLQLNDTQLILSGAVPAALLAILVDLILGRVEQWLAPPSA